MGVARSLARRAMQNIRKEARTTRYASMARQVERLHATVPMAEWQRSRIGEIRAMYETKRQQLGEKHDQLQAELSRDFMQHEIDFIMASNQFRQDNPGKEWHPGFVGKLGFMARSFWKKFAERGTALGLSYGKTSEA